MNTEEIKKRNSKYLSSIDIEVPEHLPTIESLEEVVPRSAKDVARRVCALTYVIGLAFDVKGKELKGWLDQYDLLDFVSNYEKKLLDTDSISRQDKQKMSWMPECSQALAWCLGLVELNHFKHCDDDLVKKIPFKTEPKRFIEDATIRPITEIQEQADLLYRMHWYIRNCNYTGKPCELNEGIIYQRRKAIDWVYGVSESWDNIPMDT